MGFHYAREKQAFDRDWERLRAQYLDAGMTADAIQKIYEFDWSWFLSRRRFESHAQEMPDENLSGGSDQERSKLFKKFQGAITHNENFISAGRFGWIEDIEDANLCEKLHKLSTRDLELLTLLTIEGFTQEDVAEMQGRSQNAVSKNLIKIKEFLK